MISQRLLRHGARHIRGIQHQLPLEAASSQINSNAIMEDALATTGFATETTTAETEVTKEIAPIPRPR